MSQPIRITPEDAVRKSGLLTILFGILMGAFGLAFGSAVVLGTNLIYFSALVYFACGLGMYFKASRLGAVVALGLFTSGLVTFLVALFRAEPSVQLLNTWNGWSFILSFMMTAYFFGGSLIAGVRGAFALHKVKTAVALAGSTAI
jgi:hypothetical protein